HDRRRLLAGGCEESWREVHEIHEVIDDATAGHLCAPAHGQRDAGAVIVEVALPARHAGDAMITADDDQRVLEFARGLEFREQDSKRSIERLGFAEIIRSEE